MRHLAALILAPVLIATAGAADDSAPETARLVRWLVENQGELRNVSFAEVVHAATGHRVLPVDAKRDAPWLGPLGRALDAALVTLNADDHAIHEVGRVNEASRFVEDEIRRQVNLLPGWKCSIPLTAQGREQRSGYPDLRITTPVGVTVYLDPKLHEAGSRDSTLRTFYYEPRALTGKIREDAVHLLVGVEHAGRDAETLRLTRWELIDVSRLRVQLKAEFQSSNAEIYRPEMIVGSSKE